MSDNNATEAAADTLRDFDWANYGLDEVEDAEDEWVEPLARAITRAVRAEVLRDPQERLRLARELASGSLITTAEAAEAVTKTLDTTNKRRIEADALDDMADRIDNGPTFPLPPSVISALVRERAADLRLPEEVPGD